MPVVHCCSSTISIWTGLLSVSSGTYQKFVSQFEQQRLYSILCFEIINAAASELVQLQSYVFSNHRVLQNMNWLLLYISDGIITMDLWIELWMPVKYIFDYFNYALALSNNDILNGVLMVNYIHILLISNRVIIGLIFKSNLLSCFTYSNFI